MDDWIDGHWDEGAAARRGEGRGDKPRPHDAPPDDDATPHDILSFDDVLGQGRSPTQGHAATRDAAPDDPASFHGTPVSAWDDAPGGGAPSGDEPVRRGVGRHDEWMSPEDDELFVWRDLAPRRERPPEPAASVGDAGRAPDAAAPGGADPEREAAAASVSASPERPLGRFSAAVAHLAGEDAERVAEAAPTTRREAAGGAPPARRRPAPPSGPGRRGTPAGKVLMAMLLGFFLAGLLTAPSIERRVSGQPFTAKRTVLLGLLKPMTVLSSVTGLDGAANALNTALGRGEGEHHTLADLEKPAKGKKSVYPRDITRKKPLKLYIAGDSMVGVFGSSLKNLAEDTKLMKARVYYQVSTGLSRPDYFDWPQHLIDQIVEYKPEAVVLMFGANDGQSLMEDGEVLSVGTAAWQEAYRKRVAKVMKLATKGGRRLYWVGQPIARKHHFREKYSMMDKIYAAEADKHAGVFYISTWSLMADDKGGYAEYLRDDDGELVLMRASDGIHLTRAGGDRMAAAVLQVIEKDWGIRP